MFFWTRRIQLWVASSVPTVLHQRKGLTRPRETMAHAPLVPRVTGLFKEQESPPGSQKGGRAAEATGS